MLFNLQIKLIFNRYSPWNNRNVEIIKSEEPIVDIEIKQSGLLTSNTKVSNSLIIFFQLSLMDQQRLERDFSQLKFPVFDWTRATNWSQPSADLAHSAVDRQRRFSDRLRPYSMEGLVQDFNTALDETGKINF